MSAQAPAQARSQEPSQAPMHAPGGIPQLRGVTGVVSKNSHFFMLGFGAFLLSLTAPNLLGVLQSLFGVQLFDPVTGEPFFFVRAMEGIELLLLIASGVLIFLGALTSTTTTPRRLIGGALGLAFLLLPLSGVIWSFFMGGMGSDHFTTVANPAALLQAASYNLLFVIIQIALSVVLSAALFLAWGVSRPFRGPGYFGLLIGVASAAVSATVIILLPDPASSFVYGVLLLISTALVCIPPVVAVLTARAFEQRLPAVEILMNAEGDVAQHPRQAQGNNSLAVMSLIFSLLGVGLVGVILGHIALGQIRRTGAQGAGMSLAGVILGYAQIVALALVLIVGLIIMVINLG